jgi:hypothetical protein
MVHRQHELVGLFNSLSTQEIEALLANPSELKRLARELWTRNTRITEEHVLLQFEALATQHFGKRPTGQWGVVQPKSVEQLIAEGNYFFVASSIKEFPAEDPSQNALVRTVRGTELVSGTEVAPEDIRRRFPELKLVEPPVAKAIRYLNENPDVGKHKPAIVPAGDKLIYVEPGIGATRNLRHVRPRKYPSEISVLGQVAA